MARPHRTLAALLAGALLLGACSDDGGGDDDPTVEDDVEALVPDTCELLTLAQLTEVTGLVFDASVPSTNQCIYTSSVGRSVISLNLFTTGGKSAEEAIAVGSEQCDEGTVSQIDPGEVAGGFACLEASVPTVSVVSRDDVVYILKGATLNEGAQAGPLLQQLSQLLAEAVLG